MVDRSTSRLRLVSGTVVLALVVALSALALPHPAAAADFPRISSIWPASATPDSLLAKHEYVVLGRYEKSRIPKIRALNPDVLLLTTDNAIEIAHEQIASYPTQWLLTQVGSTLTSAVNSTTKVLPVAATTASGKTLFIPGDLVVIGNEVATVESVAANSITVKRGAWRPAESHAAGARVAATLTYWLGTVTMDMSTFCPKVTVDAAVGPETYAENKARTSAARVFDAAWDGIYVDRTDGNQSYLVTATFTPDENRTIDPNRSNKIVTDGYSSFDSAWNAGLRVYLTGLRTRIGGSRVILGNGAWPYYDLLNGTVFERFPNASGGIAGIGWRDAVFTRDVPWSVATGKGSYTQWSTEARQPNLTTVGTYQNDNGGADGKTPDYRNMRFALTTALMGDGCLTYWYSHDDNTVLWFDEYDAAGRGTGYLGEPLGAAHPAHSALQTPDLLGGDGAFDTTAQLNPWKVVTSTGYAATKALDTAQKSGGTGSAKITVTQTPSTGAETWRANIQHTIAIEKDKPYTLTFRARADRPLALTAYIERLAGSSVAHTSFGTVNLTTEWQTFELPATPAGSDPAAKLILGFGGQPGTLWLDEMMLRAGNQRDVMRRDFEGGIALVNATNLPSTVDLGGSFRKIKGTQVPAVNNGALVTSVTLPPMDGIVLLRDDSDVTPPTTPTGVVASALDTTSVLALWSASVDANGVAGYRVYVNGTLATTVTGTSATLKNLTPGTTYTISVCAFDKTGNLSQPSIPASVTTPQSQDTTGPTVGGLLCLTHASPDVWYSNSGPVTFSWSQSVDPSGVVGYSTSWSTNPLTVPDNTADVVGGSLSTKSFAAPVADGVWYFKVKALDGAGNWGPVTGREVRIDTTKPTGSIILNGGLTYTSATRVSVTSNVAFGASGASQMRFDAGSGFGPWQPYAAQSQVTVTPGDGRKTVKAEFKSASGVISGPGTIAATVVLSTSVPSGSISIANGSTYTTVAGVTVASNMSFGVSGPHPTQAMRFSVNGSEWSEWKPYAATHQLTLPGADGLKTVSAQFKDAAGALSSTDAVQDSIVLDTVVPAIITLASPPPPQNRSPLTPRSAQFTWDVRVGPSEVAGYSYAFNKNTPLPPDESVDT
ncbi:MAG: fibronectin type III domain-containing protein, partial [Coriobacteriia bacterium]|nr:fibronectin type III domain-containing protein [Coriobacteriia bacterium]